MGARLRLGTFCFCGPEHHVWQEDVQHGEQLVKGCLVSKPESRKSCRASVSI